MDYKILPFEIKKADESGAFEGHAAIFGNIDDGGEIILPGAFKKTILERFGRIKVCWQHDWQAPIGKPLEMREDDQGLYVKAMISDTALGRDVRTLMRDGVVSELSIGYDVIKDSWAEVAGRQVRALHELRLYEFSPVTVAMNPLATITGVKGIDALRDCEPSEALEVLIELLGKSEDAMIDEALKALQALRAVAEPPPAALTTHDRQRLLLKLKMLEVSL